MSIEKKVLIIQCVILTVIILGIVCVFNSNLNLGLFKIIKLDTLLLNKEDIDMAAASLEKSKSEYENGLLSLQKAQKEYENQKNKYEAISDESLEIIKQATLEETYDVEYMWIKLGNYAKTNNLSINIVEPGGSVVTENNDEDGDDTVSSNESSSNNTNTQNLMISVVGNYLDLAEFVFDVENDVELRFKLDKIKMVYAQSNKVSTTFEVKNIVMEK